MDSFALITMFTRASEASTAKVAESQVSECLRLCCRVAAAILRRDQGQPHIAESNSTGCRRIVEHTVPAQPLGSPSWPAVRIALHVESLYPCVLVAVCYVFGCMCTRQLYALE